MIYTSSYNECNTNKYNVVSISGDRGKSVNYEGLCYPKLAPKKGFWQIWHDNIGKVGYDANNKYYIEEYYKQVLSNLDVQEVYEELDNSILLCYEKSTEFCHRHIVSAWFELLLGVEVKEISINDSLINKLYTPTYIKYYLQSYLNENNELIRIRKR